MHIGSSLAVTDFIAATQYYRERENKIMIANCTQLSTFKRNI